MRGLITALRTLTILPVPGREEGAFSSSLPWFPFVGLMSGATLFSLGFLWRSTPGVNWPWGGAVLLLVAEIILTRGLHLDGLADWADAVGAHRGRSERLRIMKDSRLGTFGVLALIVVLFAKGAALERMLASGSILCLLPICTISRDMMVGLMTSLPYAGIGEGMARPFMEGASSGHRVLSGAATLGICLCFGPSGLALLGTGWIISRTFRASCERLFGGATGDLLGTDKEIVETILFILCALPGGRVLHYTGWSWL